MPCSFGTPAGMFMSFDVLPANAISLSFPMYDDFDNIKEPIVCLGDIVISLEKAYEQGHNLYHSVFHEIAFLSIHSTLHLLGYDHERSKEDEDEMIRKQKEIMEIIGF